MNNTKDIKDYFEKGLEEKLLGALNCIKEKGFTKDTYTTLRMLENDIKNINATKTFFDAWYEEA